MVRRWRWIGRCAATMWLAATSSMPVCGQALDPPNPAAPAPAAPTPTQPAPVVETVTAAAVQQRLDAVKELPDLTDELKVRITDPLKKALEVLQQAEAHRAATTAFQTEAQNAPQQLEQIKAKLAEPTIDPASITRQATTMTDEQVDQRFRAAEAALTDARTQLRTIEDRLRAMQERPAAIPGLLIENRKIQDQIDAELAAAPPADEPAEVTDAKRTLLRARKQMRLAEAAMLREERLGFDARQSMLSGQRDLALRAVAAEQAQVEAWGAESQRRKRIEAVKGRQRAEQILAQLADAPSAVRDLAEANVEYETLNEQLTAQLARTTEDFNAALQRLTQTDKDFKDDQERAKYGLTESNRMRLDSQRRDLMTEGQFRHATRQRSSQTEKGWAKKIEIESRRRELANIDEAAKQVMQSIGTLAEAQRAAVRDRVVRLLRDQHEVLVKLEAAYGSYLRKLSDLDAVQQRLVELSNEYRRFIDGQLLWTRSMRPVGTGDVLATGPATMWLIDPGHWLQFGRDMWTSIVRSTTVWSAAGIAVGALAGLRRRLRRKLMELTEQVGRFQGDSLRLTWRALLCTAALATMWPLIPAFVGWQLLTLPDAATFTRAVSTGLLAAAISLAVIGFVHRVCSRSGLAIHFRWPQPMRLQLRANLLWLLPAAAGLSFVLAAVTSSGEDAYSRSLGRWAFVVKMVVMAVFFVRVMRPGGGVASMAAGRSRSSWVVRLWYVWIGLAVGTPLVLAAMSMLGYHYTAMQLEGRLQMTVVLVIGLALLNEMALRWLIIEQRKLAMAELKRKREAAQEERGTAGEGDAPALEEPQVGLDQINEQTRNLIRTVIGIGMLVGMWMVWASVLPALNVLNSIDLPMTWTDRSGGTAREVAITLGDLMLSLLVVFFTFVAARNLPGVAEITILKRLPMDAGARYAFSTICRYVIIAVGAVSAFNMIGVNWSNLQWLIAALSVGLGFGLQEIVANFISGLIILFERPFRVGDTVTIGDTSGTVVRIRIRATTITDWDRRELIVPNKEFITGRLVNWTLTDPVLRVVIPVGIAYGSDTALAERLLYRSSQQVPTVLKDPEPVVVFKQFGDSTLNFELRVFVNGVQNLVPTTHALHKAIDRAFRENGINIAFPQRDVHIDGIGPIEVRMVDRRGRSGKVDGVEAEALGGTGRERD